MTEATLYVVATPIGNLDDLSPRARRTLETVDLIAAEDTRHTGRLLAHFSIATPMVSMHDHNEAQVVEQLIDKLGSGTSIALVSDAGTPLVSDPGFRLVHAARVASLPVVTVPGPSALTAALAVAGLPTDRFAFEGFLPSKRQARRSSLERLKREPRTLVFYESVHRIGETLEDMAAVFGKNRQAFVGRELTKLHEQGVLATLSALAAAVGDGQIPSRGEFVIVVAGVHEETSTDEKVPIDQLLGELCAVLPGKQAVEIVSRVTGTRRNDIYQRMLAMKNDND